MNDRVSELTNFVAKVQKIFDICKKILNFVVKKDLYRAMTLLTQQLNVPELYCEEQKMN
jgi:hypothetical protein